MTQTIISNIFVFVNTFFKKIENYFSGEFSVITLSILALILPYKNVFFRSKYLSNAVYQLISFF